MVDNGNLASFVLASSEVFNVGYGSRVLQFAPFTFDASRLEWATALLGEYLADVVGQNQITFLHITPTALSTLPSEMAPESMQQISIGGEACSESLMAEWHDRVDIVNAYGPTEAS